MRNAEIALHFDELADLYELDGAIVHRVVAYRNAAKAIREATASIEEMSREGTVTQLAGIGKTIAEKIATLLETGAIPSAEKLKAKYPPGLIEVTRLPGFGPKRARKLFDELGVQSLDDLRAAVEQERLRDVPGFGEKAEENVRQALEAGPDPRKKPRLLLSRALSIGEALLGGIREPPAAERGGLAGSARRRGGTVQGPPLLGPPPDPRGRAAPVARLP